MTFKKQGGKYYAINESGETVAYIEKNYFGTHGHSRGWKHFAMSKAQNKIVPADYLYYFEHDEEIQFAFCNINDFKKYYEGRT